MSRSNRPRRRLPGLIAGMLAALVIASHAGPVPALTISLSYDEDDSPAFDPDGSRLMTIARAAADIWEWHILDDEEIEMDISWDNLDGENRLAKYVPSYVPFDSIDIVISTHRNNAVLPWFFDPTPHAHEEFGAFTHTLLRDLDPVHADEAIAGPNISLLEVGVAATAPSTSPASLHFDLLTALLHEFGHALGMNFSATDDDYDFDSDDIGGFDVGVVEGPGYELVLNTALMNDSIAVTGRRTLPSAADILATHDQNDYEHFNLRRIDLLGGHSEDWNDTLNWIGGKTPEWYNDAFLRSGRSVRIESGLAQARSLLVDEGSQLFTANSSHLQVIHDIRVGNAANGTRGEIHIGNFSGSPWLEAETLHLEKGFVHLVSQAAVLVVHGAANIGQAGTLMGAGTVEVQGELNNDGEISAGTFFLFGTGGDLLLRAIDNGRLDLDGGRELILDPGLKSFVLPGQFNDEYGRLTAVHGNLRVLSPLADSFNGTATIGAGRTMHFYQPWSFGGSLIMRGGSSASEAATLTGAEIQFGGNTTVEQGVANITAPLVTNNLTRILVKTGARLNLATSRLGPTSSPLDFVGSLTLQPGAVLNVDLPGTSWTLKKSLVMGSGALVMGDSLVNNGRIQGSGDLAIARLDNAGVVAPAFEFRVPNGIYTQTSAGRLEIDLAGMSQGASYDVLRADVANLAGTLAINLAANFLPAVGTQFDIVTAGRVARTFTALELNVPSGVHFSGQLVYDASKVSFHVTQARFAADFDADGDVDDADMAVWKASSGIFTSAGDADGDGDADGADMLMLQRQLGSRVVTMPKTGFGGHLVGNFADGGVMHSTPEPSSMLMASAALALTAVSRRRSARSPSEAR